MNPAMGWSSAIGSDLEGQETPGVLPGETPGTGSRGVSRQGREKRRRWNRAGRASLRRVDM